MKKGIVLVIFLLTLNFSVFAQTAGTDNEGPQVLVQTNPEIPIIGKQWTLTLIIDYPDPEDVTVIAPAFGAPNAGALAMERILKLQRIIETRPQTFIEYRFTPNRSGRFTIGSFTILTPEGVTATKPLVLNIRYETEELKSVVLKLAWEGASAQIEQGERTAIFLRCAGTDLQQMLPQNFFMPDVPSGGILLSLPVSAENRAEGILAMFNFIPISGSFNLPARTLQFENTIYEIPALQINIKDRVPEQITETSSENADEGAGLSAAVHQTEENLLNIDLSDNSRLQRVLRMGFFYSVLSLVIIIMFVCLYLLIKKKSAVPR